MSGSPSRRRNERGAIVLLATVGMVLAMVASALAVDTGRIAQERRRDQRVADLAALDAVWEVSVPGQALQRARQSAERNDFPWDSPGYDLQVDVGSVDANNVFQPGVGQTAVRVIASSPLDHAFMPGGRTVSAEAVASAAEHAGFSIGSSLASADTANTVLVNRIMERLLGASAGSVSLVGYQGLATAGITLDELRAQLGFGTLDQLLAADLTLGQLLNATAAVLTANGSPAAVDVNSLSLVVNKATTFQLGNMIAVDQGAQSRALGAQLNVLQLISGTAAMANQNNFLDVGSVLTVPVPGVGNLSTAVGVTVIEGPQYYFGPVNGPSVSTAQFEVVLRPTVDVNISVGLSVLRLVGLVPVTFEAAGADGTLTGIQCGSVAPGITVRVDSQALSTGVATTLDVRGLLNLKVAEVVVGPASSATAPASETLSFAHPAEFWPPAPSKSTSGAPLTPTLSGANVVVNVLGALPLGVNAAGILNASLGVLNPVVAGMVGEVQTADVAGALAALGVVPGPVDVSALEAAFDPGLCGKPALVG